MLTFQKVLHPCQWNRQLIRVNGPQLALNQAEYMTLAVEFFVYKTLFYMTF